MMYVLEKEIIQIWLGKLFKKVMTNFWKKVSHYFEYFKAVHRIRIHWIRNILVTWIRVIMDPDPHKNEALVKTLTTCVLKKTT